MIIYRYIRDYVNPINGIDIIPNMLKTQCLHFSRSDKFEDKWEGIPSRKDYAMYDLLNKYRIRTAINCWQENDFESYLMWKTYIGKGNGIAIKSSIGRLKSIFEKSIGNDEYIGRLEYCKFKEFPTETNRFQPVLRKRIQYRDEKEVRVISAKQNDGIFDEYGINIPVSFDKLIDKIYISPNSDDSFHDKIKHLFNKYYPNIEVLPSELDEKRPEIDSRDIPECEVHNREWSNRDASGNLTIYKGKIYYTKLKEK